MRTEDTKPAKHTWFAEYINNIKSFKSFGPWGYFRRENTREYKRVGSITVPLTSCLTGLDLSVLQIKTKIVRCHTADTKPVKQEVNSTVILPPLVFPENTLGTKLR
jgi:hypothetical protein